MAPSESHKSGILTEKMQNLYSAVLQIWDMNLILKSRLPKLTPETSRLEETRNSEYVRGIRQTSFPPSVQRVRNCLEPLLGSPCLATSHWQKIIIRLEQKVMGFAEAMLSLKFFYKIKRRKQEQPITAPGKRRRGACKHTKAAWPWTHGPSHASHRPLSRQREVAVVTKIHY